VNETRGSGIPSILLITLGDTHDERNYELLTMANNMPVVQLANGYTRADYTLSDIEYDTQINTTYWNLNVISDGTKRHPDVFQDRLEDVGSDVSLQYIISLVLFHH
jgi:hypothetical protein